MLQKNIHPYKMFKSVNLSLSFAKVTTSMTEKFVGNKAKERISKRV